MQLADIRVGMVLTNDGHSPIPLYDGTAGNVGDPPILSIQPGQLIGQVTDKTVGSGGAVIVFTDPHKTNIDAASGAIEQASTISQKTIFYLKSYLPFVRSTDHSIAASASFASIQANVSDKQIADQLAAMAQDTVSADTIAAQTKQLILDPSKGVVQAATDSAADILSHAANKAGDVVTDSNLKWWALGLGALWLASKSKTVKNL